MSRIKIWIARKWLHLLTLNELELEVQRRTFNEAFEPIAKNMIDIFYEAVK